MGEIVSLLLFCEDGFGINCSMKVDIPFKKGNQTKPNLYDENYSYQ